MPTLLNENGFRFFFYSNDHNPAHVHIEKGGKSAKVELLTLKIISNNGLKNREIKKMMTIIKSNKDTFKEKWNEYFPE